MPITNLWSQSVPRVELDQRSREARLRFERTDQLFILRATVTHARLRRLVYWFTVGRYGGLPQEIELGKLPNDRWRTGLPMFFGLLRRAEAAHGEHEKRAGEPQPAHPSPTIM